MKEDDIDITDKDDLKDFKIEGSCYVNDKFIGTAVAKKITVNICDNGKYNLENKEISVKTGIDIDGKVEYVPMGNYVIEKPTTQEVTLQTQFVGYDYMVKFNITYENRVTYPIKASDLLKDVCEQVGVECGSVEFVNSDYLILGNPFTNNEDCKTVLSNIAQLAGGFANIGRDNKVYIKTLTTINDLLRVKDVHFISVKELNFSMVNKVAGISDVANDNIDGDNYFEFSKNNKFGKVNSLILKISGTEGENTTIQDEESIKENGLTELTIEDNYFLINQTEREKVIKQLWNNLKGLEYLPFEAKYYGYPYLDLGDMLCIKDTDDKEYVSYVFDYTFEYNGIYNGTLKTEAMTKTQTAYKNTNDVKTKFKNTERKIDKINGIIEDIVEETSENTKKIAKQEISIEGITQEVSQKVGNDEFSTKLQTDWESVKIAWNQISEFIQMMIINNNASLAILDENKNVMMALDKKGQHFYESDGTTVFGEMGVQTVDDNNYIAFSIPTNYNESINDGMAWGVTTSSDGKFHPILYIKNFTMPPLNSGGCTGELQLDGCNLVLGGENSCIISNGIKIMPEALGGISFLNEDDDTSLLTIINNSVIGKKIYMLGNISFYPNEAGTNTFRIGNDENNYCLLTDEGYASCNDLYARNSIYTLGYLTGVEGINSSGYVSGKAFVNNSKLEVKKNIEKYSKKAIDEIKNTDIYEFNYKIEEDNDKKTVGAIIGNGYNCSKEIIANNGEGINTYSMISVAYKAIQEQQEQIEQLQEKDKQKDEIIIDLIKRIETLEKEVNK